MLNPKAPDPWQYGPWREITGLEKRPLGRGVTVPPTGPLQVDQRTFDKMQTLVSLWVSALDGDDPPDGYSLKKFVGSHKDCHDAYKKWAMTAIRKWKLLRILANIHEETGTSMLVVAHTWGSRTVRPTLFPHIMPSYGDRAAVQHLPSWSSVDWGDCRKLFALAIAGPRNDNSYATDMPPQAALSFAMDLMRSEYHSWGVKFTRLRRTFDGMVEKYHRKVAGT